MSNHVPLFDLNSDRTGNKQTNILNPNKLIFLSVVGIPGNVGRPLSMELIFPHLLLHLPGDTQNLLMRVGRHPPPPKKRGIHCVGLQ